MKKKEPCKECPFRRSSPAGWLGEHETSQEIANIVLFDGFFPCHMEVTKETEKGVPFDEAVQTSSSCIGSLAFMNNQFKRSRDHAIAKEQDQVGQRDDCFKFAVEMRAHHGK